MQEEYAMTTNRPRHAQPRPEIVALQPQSSNRLAGRPSPYANEEAMANTSNPLLQAATPLITLIAQIKHTVEQSNVPALRAQVVEEIKSFEQKLVAIQYPMRIIVAARYALCTAIDEAVLNRPWGTQSIWVQQSLLSFFQKETWGGERFYIILENMLQNVSANIDFIELVYFLMSLGFEGKIYGNENRATREEIRNRIFYHIRHARKKPTRTLSRNWRSATLPTYYLGRRQRIKRIMLSSLAALVVVAGLCNLAAHHKASPIIKQLNTIGATSPITTFSDVIQRSTVIRN